MTNLSPELEQIIQHVQCAEELTSDESSPESASISKVIEELPELTPGSDADTAADVDSVAGGDEGCDDEAGGEEELVFPHLNEMPLPSMQEEAGPSEQGVEVPPTRVERQRSVHGSDHCIGRAATFDRAPNAYTSIQSVNSMPDTKHLKKSKKPPTFGKVFRSSPPISPNPASSGDASKDTMKKARALVKFASKALEMKDVDVAVKRLKEALQVLGQ